MWRRKPGRRLQPLTTFAPRARATTVTLPRRQFTDAEIIKARDVARRMMTENLGTVPMAEAVCILETEAKRDLPLEAEVQVVALSDDCAIVSLPGEIFVELGLAHQSRVALQAHLHRGTRQRQHRLRSESRGLSAGQL